MPARLRVCCKAGCPELVRGESYCPAHRREVRREAEAGRPSATERGYGREWRKIRAAQLERSPTCQDPAGCIARATHVDHVRPRRDGGSDLPENLRSLCVSCHNRKTASLDGGFGNARQ